MPDGERKERKYTASSKIIKSKNNSMEVGVCYETPNIAEIGSPIMT